MSRATTIQVRPVLPDDIDEIVSIHRHAFAGFFLTQLGERFLRLYYGSVLDFDGGILLLAEDESGTGMGFVAGFADSGEFYRRLKRRRIAVGWSVLPALLRSPRLVRRLLASSSLAAERIDAGEDAAVVELSSIAVGPAGRGRGVGKRLLAGFCDVAIGAGARTVVLTTDALDNDAVNQFYAHAGFDLTRSFNTAAGREMNEYRYELETGSDAGPESMAIPMEREN